MQADNHTPNAWQWSSYIGSALAGFLARWFFVRAKHRTDTEDWRKLVHRVNEHERALQSLTERKARDVREFDQMLAEVRDHEARIQDQHNRQERDHQNIMDRLTRQDTTLARIEAMLQRGGAR